MIEKKPDFNYIGQCPRCKQYCAVVVDDSATKQGRKDTSEALAGFVRQGLIVSRVDNDFVRTNFGSCRCAEIAAAGNGTQLTMFEE